MLVLMERAYPYLASVQANGLTLAAVRIVALICMAAVILLPIAAVIRRLTRYVLRGSTRIRGPTPRRRRRVIRAADIRSCR
ncbi:hypothetical protein [Asanoa ferruginea]|uniref:hypothetical protein n=1 Tax=Asanoa ferruginea TaxID=53367 RepID=UPI0011C10124|nr:hypothetical protein [Asanoa ferruginea]